MRNNVLPPCLGECDFVAALAVAPDGTVLDCNETLRNLLKTGDGMLVGRPLETFLFPGQPGLREKIAQGIPPGESSKIRLRASDGSPVCLDFREGSLDGGPGTLLLAPVRTAEEEDTLAKLYGELAKKTVELEEANAVITRLENTDPLTGVANRRHFEDVAERAMAFSRRKSLPLSLIMADIDHFGPFNKRYGHAKGDEALSAFARMLFGSCRFEDTVARYGGGEFLALLPGTPLVPARAIAKRLRENTEKIRIDGLDEGIRASFGVTEFLADETLQEMIARAEQALHKAKSLGRNRVEG